MGKPPELQYKIKVLLLLLSLPVICKSQEFWFGGELDVDLTKKFFAGLETQVRSADGMATYNGYYGEAGAGYKINKHIKLKLVYRYTNKAGHHDSEVRPTNNRERISGDVSLDFGKKVSLKYRCKYQYTRERNTYKKYNYIRNKLGFNYDLHDIAEPFIAGEIFYRLDMKNQLRAYRYTFGLDSKINKNLNVKSFFRMENEINVNYPQKYYIIGVMFTYGM